MSQPPTIAAQPKGKAWHSHSAEEVLAQLASTADGLSAQEAAQRLASNGPNELKEGQPISPLQIFLGQFKSLIIWTRSDASSSGRRWASSRCCLGWGCCAGRNPSSCS